MRATGSDSALITASLLAFHAMFSVGVSSIKLESSRRDYNEFHDRGLILVRPGKERNGTSSSMCRRKKLFYEPRLAVREISPEGMLAATRVLISEVGQEQPISQKIFMKLFLVLFSAIHVVLRKFNTTTRILAERETKMEELELNVYLLTDEADRVSDL